MPRGASTTTAAFATLNQVVDHYDGHFHLQLNAQQKSDLVQFLKSL